MSRRATLAQRVIAAARDRGLTIATAESLTGGLVADALVSVPGASLVFNGGVVAYATDLKRSLLAVDPGLLARTGPVDARVAEQMAEGVRHACAIADGAANSLAADIGIATTGVAGPDPDPQTGQPPGTVWIGVSVGGVCMSVLVRAAPTGRESVRREAVRAALEATLAAMAQDLECP